MSTTLEKRTLREAIADAEAFRALFAGTYERWEIAGSVRRRKPHVGDVEHVVIARVVDVASADLFGTPRRVDLVADRRDELLAAGAIARHVYGHNEHGAPKHRWGDVNSGADFRGFNHEIFGALPDNWGSKLAILTGPAEFSTMLVSRLHRNGYRNHLGRVWRCGICPENAGVERCPKDCEHCQGTGLKPMAIVPVPTEELFFGLAGVPWAEPEQRR